VRDGQCGLARATLWGVWVLTVVSSSAGARAQDALDVHTFKPAAGRSAALTIPDPELPAHGTLTLGLGFDYALRPLTRTVDCSVQSSLSQYCDPGTQAATRLVLVSDMVQADLSVSLSLFDAISLGVVLPAVSSTVAADPEALGQLTDVQGLGDLRLSAQLTVLHGDSALALGFVVSLPTGEPGTLAAANSWTLLPDAVFRQRIGPVALSASLGYLLRKRAERAGFEHDDELQAGLGARVGIFGPLEGRAELRARVGIGGQWARADENPVEADGALGVRLAGSVLLLGGAGAGIWPGREGYGSPDFRAFASVRWEFQPIPCRFGPEDRDGFEDSDFCRDPDNDHDGIDDTRDACPNDAEDLDGFEDRDGCPDLDNDADGLLDVVDQCPEKSEDRDGFEDGDGCPEPDNDADGLLDALDACPLDPEDKDGFEDDDGCPEPGPTPVSVSVVEQHILVSERIYFDDGRDTIRQVSMPVLDQVASVIRGLRSGLKVIVEGHTDDAGTPAYNLDLSHRRARAVVEYLRARGVDPERLDYVGLGATKPLGPNDSPEGRALNRRVEFRIE
jgi:outer membrane protein OmpA-like peptidoglycan-associated protein